MAFTFCLNTSTIKPQPLLDKIQLAAEAGFPAIELWINDVYEFVGRGGEVREVTQALEAQGLTVPSMIAIRAWGEASEEEYPLMLDEARRRMELATRFQARWLVCSPPREPTNLAQITRRYRDLLSIGREIGVRPTFEYISFFHSVYSLGQAWQVVESAEDPDATLILDAFHSWNSGSTLDELRHIPAERISHYHIDDAAWNIPAGQQRDADRVMPGEGVIDLAAEIQALRDIGYDGFVSLELFNRQLWEMDPREVLARGYAELERLFDA